ncbi:MAG: gluconate 2-dehydrogenase subunit 3 family protein [Sphingomonadales bacterium]|nr:gluconate 2-dehydrogenase subunit 3 family protein [Sphingomonadales bacterium]
MTKRQPGGWDRRDFLAGAALLALALGVPFAAVKLSDLPADLVPTARQRQLMKEVSQLVIPRTATAGAGEVGTGDFVILALAHGLEEARAALLQDAPQSLRAHRRADGSLDQMRWLEAELDHRAGGDFLDQDAAARSAALGALDAEAYAHGADGHPWRTVKALVLTGYYTSEIGGSKELRFELVPGRYDPDLPVTAQTRAYSSDWTAVDFG